MTNTATTWCRPLTTSPSAVLAGEDACRGMMSSARGPQRAAASPPRRAVAALIVALAALLAMPAGGSAQRAVLLEIDGAIGPAVADYVVREMRATKQADTSIIILRMNTPGGLDTSMREIIRAILSSPIPVAAYVAPRGARAASAGTYIAYASAIAAMAPGTNLGAATPIQLGKPLQFPGGTPDQPSGQKKRDKESEDKAGGSPATEPADTETRKVVNDAVAYIRSLAELNGRNRSGRLRPCVRR